MQNILKLNKFLFIIATILSLNSVAFSDNHRLRNVHQQFIIQDKILEFTSPYQINAYGIPVTNLGLDYYYKVISDAEREKLAELISTKVVEKLKTSLPPTTPNPTNPTNIPTANDGNTQITALLTNKCINCHKGQEAKGGLSIFNENGTLADLTNEQKWNIFDRTDASNLAPELVMPKGGTPLTNEEVTLIRLWVRGE